MQALQSGDRRHGGQHCGSAWRRDRCAQHPALASLRTLAQLPTLPPSPLPAAAELESALQKCVEGYGSGDSLAPGTLACLPPYPAQCSRVANAGAAC